MYAKDHASQDSVQASIAGVASALQKAAQWKAFTLIRYHRRMNQVIPDM